MSAATASQYVRRMVAEELANSGNRERAFDVLARRYGLTRSQIRHLRDGRAKTVEAGLFARIRAAYLDLVERQIKKLEHELALERAMGGEDEALDRAERTLEELLSSAPKKTQAAQRLHRD